MPLFGDSATDVWALGVMLHEVFTCANPDWKTAFQPADDADLVQGILTQQDDWVRTSWIVDCMLLADSCCSTVSTCLHSL